MIIVQRKRFQQKEISAGWFKRFREQQPDVSLWKGDSMVLVHSHCTDKETIDNHYDLLETMMEENDL